MIGFTSLMAVTCTNQRCVIRILGVYVCHLFDCLLVIVSGRNELDQYDDASNEKKIEKSPWEMYICTLNKSLICFKKRRGIIPILC